MFFCSLQDNARKRSSNSLVHRGFYSGVLSELNPFIKFHNSNTFAWNCYHVN